MEHLFDALLVAFTGILAVATSRLVQENKRLWKVARDTADAAKQSAEAARQGHQPFVVVKGLRLRKGNGSADYSLEFKVVDMAGVLTLLDKIDIGVRPPTGRALVETESVSENYVGREGTYESTIPFNKGKGGEWIDPELILATVQVYYRSTARDATTWCWTTASVTFQRAGNEFRNLTVDPGGRRSRVDAAGQIVAPPQPQNKH